MTEAELAKELGVSRARLREWRKTATEGTHWAYGAGSQVVLTPEGEAALRTALLSQANLGEKGAGEALEGVGVAETEKGAAGGESEAAAGVVVRDGEGMGTTEAPRHRGPAVGEKADGEWPPEVLVVVRLVRNPKLVMARRAGAGEEGPLYRVLVRNNAMFVPGMEIPVRHVQADMFDLARRCPRFKGRW